MGRILSAVYFDRVVDRWWDSRFEKSFYNLRLSTFISKFLLSENETTSERPARHFIFQRDRRLCQRPFDVADLAGYRQMLTEVTHHLMICIRITFSEKGNLGDTHLMMKYVLPSVSVPTVLSPRVILCFDFMSF